MRMMGLAVAATLGAAMLIGSAQAEQVAASRQPVVAASNYGTVAVQQPRACPPGSWWMPAQKDVWNNWQDAHCVQ